MHKIPLGFAIVIFFLQLFLALGNPGIFDETIWFSLGLNALFIIIPIIRIIFERVCLWQDYKKKIEFEKLELKKIIDDNNLNDEDKILKIFLLAKEGNSCATLLLEKLMGNIEQ